MVAHGRPRSTRRVRDGNVLSGFDPQMKSAPPPPVDRIERTVNPLALAILVVCLAGALLALWLAPSAIGASLMTWMIVILAICGAFGLLLFAFGLLQFPTRAARLDTTKAIANSSPDGILVTDREIADRLRQRRLSSAFGRARRRRPASRSSACSPARPTSRSRSIAWRRRPNPERGRARSCVSRRRRAARARSPGTAFAFARSRARPRTA